jgi:hypothetical protein
MKIFAVAIALTAAVSFLGCGAHTSLVPLGNGKLAPHLSIGGPIVEAFDTHIPIPYLLAGADYGVRENVNVNASVHLLPIFYSVAGVDVGAAWFPLENRGWQPSVGVGPRLFVFASTKRDAEDRFLLYPAVSGSAAWKAGGGLLYAGADLAIPLEQPDYDEEAESVILSPFVGYRWKLGEKYALHTELKWNGANIETDKVVAGYTAVGNRGAVTPLLAIQRSL